MVLQKARYSVSLLLLISIGSFSLTLKAQDHPSIPVLKEADGYYQHPQVKELYLKIGVSGSKLHQVRDWDGRELWLEQQSATHFTNAEDSYGLNFLIDGSQHIDGIKIGQEVWKKVPTYVPEKITDLNQQQARAILDGQAEKFVRAMNANSAAVMADYIEDNFSPALKSSSKNELLSRFQGIYRSTGGVKLLKNLYFNTNAFFGEYQYLSKDLNNVYEFSIKLDNSHKVKLYNGRVFFNPELIRKPRTEQAFLTDLDQTLKRLAQKDVFSGALLLAKGDELLYQYTCGSAIKHPDLKNTTTTRFNIGSMNKMFTAIGVMQLMEKGKLNLNDPVSKFLDSTWLPLELSGKIQIRHLLNHSSGLGDFFSKAMQEDTTVANFQTLEGYKKYLKQSKLNFEPGTSWSYSNSGMLLLGGIIEKVSGQNYFDYIDKNIHALADMTNSNPKLEKGMSGNQALGYIPKQDGSYESNLNSAFTRPSPAGGGYSTTTDLHKFGRALLSGKLLTDSSRQKMFKDELGMHYGYGFQIWDTPGKQVVGHSGGAPGVSAVAYFFPETGYMVIILSNYDRGSADLGEYLLNQVRFLGK
ncbi:serine hydrolase domain-containing protein [Pedobacter sp. PACM 27299]|uniref:serine hydrolase domain-containing protein n=1 Tax=Pedobacter sp. PACM 27299 TaxID=1727164 RepID=UPI0009E814FC|nr:serine hydrolase domain-containing protein [Pedobacter sp. PACM 27299]